MNTLISRFTDPANIVPGVLLGVLLIWLFYLWRSENRGALLQVVYLIRFPIIIGFFLLLFPIFAVTSDSGLLGNLYTFDNPFAITFVVWMSIVVAWMVMYTLGVILYSMPQIYGNTLPGYLNILQQQWGNTWVGRHRIWVFALLAVPSVVISIFWAEIPIPFGVPGPKWVKGVNIFLGVLSSGLAVWLAWRLYKLVHWVRPKLGPTFDAIGDWLRNHLSRLSPFARAGYASSKEDDFRHEGALSFFVMTFTLYVICGWLLNPGWRLGKMIQAPVVIYLMLLLLMWGWILSAMSNWLDRYRVPVSLVIIIFTFATQTLANTNHLYTVVPRQVTISSLGLVDTLPFPNEVLRARRDYQDLKQERQPNYPEQPESKPVVIVMASGGGITAALWTAQVLTGLQKELGEEFADYILLISAVSGGGVGAMYYVNGFTPLGGPPTAHLDEIVAKAGQSTTEHAAWGLTYPDMWRALFLWLPRLIFDRRVDRGWALERTWDERMQLLAQDHNKARDLEIAEGKYEDLPLSMTQDPSSIYVFTGTTMLSAWQDEGWRPAIIFNSTETETGRRFLFTTAQLPTKDSTRSFQNVFPLHDVPVVTAARMASTFPYVSPIASADLTDEDLKAISETLQLSSTVDVENWNLADGGYFDNDGVVSALQFLDDVLKRRALQPGQLPPRRIVLIQILASPRASTFERCDASKANLGNNTSDFYSPPDAMSNEIEKPQVRNSWVNEFLGPILTLMNTRGSSQVERGQFEIDRYIRLKLEQNEQLRVLYCIFDMRDSNVLSWQLAPSEVKAITEAWEEKSTVTPSPPRPYHRRVDQIRNFLNLATPTPVP